MSHMHERSMADKTRRKDQEAGLTSEGDDGAQSWSLALRMVRPVVGAGNLHAVARTATNQIVTAMLML